jgi:mono/diheme cytochrome c family protein
MIRSALLSAAVMLQLGGALGTGLAAVPPPVEVFFTTHCVRCHGDAAQEGQFRIDTLPREFTKLGASQTWAEVMTRINAGEMPPAEETRPTNDEIRIGRPMALRQASAERGGS